MIDAFIDAIVPHHLVTVEALTDAARVAPLLLVNVIDDRIARDVREIAAGVAAAFPYVWALGSRSGNTIVVGQTAPPRLDRDRRTHRGRSVTGPAHVTEAACAPDRDDTAPWRRRGLSPPAGATEVTAAAIRGAVRWGVGH
ncbi:MAG: hypothetical protein M3065_01100 [Actinomycetota bacterium]|nr:hypothetical protein [Actinomycetota bacterium]